MKFKFTMAITIFAAIWLTACGGRGDPSTGLDKQSLLVDLDPRDTRLLCTWAIEVTDGLICEDGEHLNGFTFYECSETYEHLPTGCEATVGHFEDCILLLRACGEDAALVLAACNPLTTCSTSE